MRRNGTVLEKASGVPPFAGVVGLERVKRALLLLAVAPALKGVLIRSEAATGKSLAGRAFRDLLPGGAPFVEVPPRVGADALLGSLDWERTLAKGRVSAAPGLLSRAHGGALVLDQAHLVDLSAAGLIAAALDTSVLQMERDSVSARFDAGFVVVGAYDPREGAPPAPLVDSVALQVDASGSGEAEERLEVMELALELDRDPAGFRQRHATEMDRLRKRIAEAQARLPAIRMTRRACEYLAARAIELGVQGHRADFFATCAAKAHAALAGRRRVEDEDLEAAVELALRPRGSGTSTSAAGAGDRETSGDRAVGAGQSSLRTTNGAAPPDRSQGRPESAPPPVEVRLSERLLNTMLESVAATGARGFQAASRGPGQRTESGRRGRYVRAAQERTKAGVIAVEATLRAAAPYQRLRPRNAGAGSGGRCAIRIAAGDLRFKRFAAKVKSLIVFAVDGSGSMAQQRMGYAKGAVLRLLRGAYVNRDEVALISFRDAGAAVLVPPTRSVERAKRLTAELPVGGGTPLGAGLLAASRLIHEQQRRGARHAVLAILTDGGANVPLHPEGMAGDRGIWEEIARIAAAFPANNLTALVIDTNLHPSFGGRCETLARLLGARYFRLPRQAGAAAGAVIETALSAVRPSAPKGARA